LNFGSIPAARWRKEPLRFTSNHRPFSHTRMSLRRFAALLLLTVSMFSGCATADPQGTAAARAAMLMEIRNEPKGDYYIGRRFYKTDYKFWGYVRKPGEPWSTAKLVMLYEHSKLAPDREMGKIGSDNNYEYKLYGAFSGQTVYEPASNGFYPEFVLKGYELRSVSPARIFKEPNATDPKRRVIPQPY
jgi:hypothetical protein